MKTTDEIYIKLTDIFWDVLNANEDISRFKDESVDVCLNDGYELDVLEEYWRM